MIGSVPVELGNDVNTPNTTHSSAFISLDRRQCFYLLILIKSKTLFKLIVFILICVCISLLKHSGIQRIYNIIKIKLSISLGIFSSSIITKKLLRIIYKYKLLQSDIITMVIWSKLFVKIENNIYLFTQKSNKLIPLLTRNVIFKLIFL